MAPFAIDLADIADLATQVGVHGAVRAGELMRDDLFDLLVAIAILVYEIAP